MTTASFATSMHYPLAEEAALKKEFVGKDLKQVPTPAAVLDVAKVRNNCINQLRIVDHLSVAFRAHCKTHKTAQLTALQVGEEPHRPVNLVVSTLPEAHIILPWLKQCKASGRPVSLLYGIPPSATAFASFRPFREALGTESVGFLLDHPAQIANLVDLEDVSTTDKEPIPVMIKADTGYHRAGLTAETQEFQTLVEAISQHARPDASAPRLKFLGLYSHLGSSYDSRTTEDALDFLSTELERGAEAVAMVENMKLPLGLSEGEKMILSVGATPQVTAAQNLLARTAAAQKVEATLNAVKERCIVELHAGNYPVLDMQQIDTHAKPAHSTGGPSLGTQDIAGFIMAEVLSLYPEREPKQALIGAGVLALGREPANYPGWGIIAPSPWRRQQDETIYSETSQTGWIVGKVAQEHGLLRWMGGEQAMRPLAVGEKVLVWPNHACIAAAHFGWYVVVDSDVDATKVADVWVRARGW